MSKWGQQFRKSQGEHGTFVLEESGLCTPDEAYGIEGGCTKRFALTALPQACGAVLKVLDGTTPTIVAITPLTYGNVYRCIKVHGQVEPFAPAQEFGTYINKAILSYVIRYQQVGGVI